jgi:ribonuclease M5
MKIKEIIVVEGRDDASAIKSAVCAEVISTHGFGIHEETWALIEKAYHEKGIIIFTDPDFSGEQIRKKLSKRFPKAKHAYLALSDAKKSDTIGVENATPEAIIDAVNKAKASFEDTTSIFTYEDLLAFGLTGDEDSSEKRAAVGKILGIGYGNSKSFLNKLNKYGITMEELHEAVLTCSHSSS